MNDILINLLIDFKEDKLSLEDVINLINLNFSLERKTCYYCGGTNLYTEGSYTFCKDCDYEQVEN